MDLEENSAQFVNRMVEGQIRDSSRKAYTSSINVIKRAIRRLYPQDIDDNNEIILEDFLTVEKVLNVFGTISRNNNGKFYCFCLFPLLTNLDLFVRISEVSCFRRRISSWIEALPSFQQYRIGSCNR